MQYDDQAALGFIPKIRVHQHFQRLEEMASIKNKDGYIDSIFRDEAVSQQNKIKDLVSELKKINAPPEVI